MKNLLRQELTIIWIFSVLLGLALIALQIKHKLPLGTGDFVFISILALCVSLYRPRWTFYVFISLVPIENVILASGFLPLQLRPFQYTGVILVISLVILWVAKHLNFKLLKPTWIDWLIFALVPLSFLPLINSPVKSTSLKNNLVLISFVVLYFLVRNFVRTKKHLIETALFFLASNVVVLACGFFQVFADKFGARSFEVFFGRPNSTFTEPDWLGVFLVFALAVNFTIAQYFSSQKNDTDAIFALRKMRFFGYFAVFLNIVLLILSLSRSAWIGAAIVIFIWLIFNLFRKSEIRTIFTPQKFGTNLGIIALILVVSIGFVYFGHLSKFDVFDRARSAATNEQKITIACNSNSNIPQVISNTSELQKYGCTHINLEDIAANQAQGKFVTQIFRNDPNVVTRSQIYRKSFEIIRQHPVLGVGYGTITQSLGMDERGAGLNESNLFLQVWAGSGILGLIALFAVFVYLFIHAFRRISPICLLNKIYGAPAIRDDFEKIVNLFIILGMFALIIPNLFNAGLFMGLFWLGLGILTSITHTMQ